MSILIKGMEMPTSCSDCLYEYETLKGETKCAICNGSIPNDESFSKRIPSCPIVEVPPHGRLIDADAFLETLNPIKFEDSLLYATVDKIKTVTIKRIKDAPTIIEEEVKT